MWAGEILSDESLRLEASNFAGRQNNAEQVTVVKYPAVSFGELASCYTRGRSVKVIASKSQYPFYQPSSVTDIKPEYDGYLSPNNAKKVEALKMRKGQVLLTCSGTVGRTVYVSDTLSGKYLSQDMIRIDCLNPNDAGYIYAYMKTSKCQKLFEYLAYGSVIKHITPEQLNTMPVPYAPEDIRRKIHELVMKSYALRDESNTMLDEAESLLVRSLGLPSMESIRREVWKDNEHARTFSIMCGDLDGRFEASYHDPVYGVLMDYVKAGASEVITAGDERVSKKIILPGRFKRVYVSEGYGAVFIGGKQIGELDPSDKKYLAFSQHEKRIRDELTIHKDMILITCSGTIGRTVLVPEHWDGWTASQHVMRVVPANNDIAGYAYVWLASEWGRELLMRCSYGAVIDEINDEHVAGIAFPLLRDSGVMARINGLALGASGLRSEAWRLEREAVRMMEEIVNPS